MEIHSCRERQHLDIHIRKNTSIVGGLEVVGDLDMDFSSDLRGNEVGFADGPEAQEAAVKASGHRLRRCLLAECVVATCWLVSPLLASRVRCCCLLGACNQEPTLSILIDLQATTKNQATVAASKKTRTHERDGR